ncbi:armadillo repeat-containing protein 6 homolog [Periplaneta americana]|uniref:armadillo repeat-containing protein 6 homolog n=1 Tax=Periplaneta americana TaxID=6978 RepID=UPI0037E7B8B7
MVRVITQETFDDVVKENMEEFDMSPEEAVQEAVQQFEAQGVDLSNIVKEAVMDSIPGASRNELTATINNLSELIKKSPRQDDTIIEELLTVKEECNKSIAHKVFAAKIGTYNVLLDILEMCQSSNDIANAALSAMIALMAGHPDLLNERGIQIIISYLDNVNDECIQKKVLEWTKECCIKHEQNRQDIFAMKILTRLKVLLHQDAPPGIVRGVCGVARALVLDDDIRVQFGKSHDHARALAEEILCTLTDLLKKFHGDKDTVCDVILTLTALIVRNEFCQIVEEAGGLTFIMDVMVHYPDSEKLNRLCLKLVKGLAGNDNVKIKIIKHGIAPFLISAMHRHEASAGLVGAGCTAMAALTLKCPTNAKVLYDDGAPEVILQGMKIHLNDSSVQKQGSWAIRNIVSRDKSLVTGFLKLEAEEILKCAIKIHGNKCEFDAKAALRDLGIDVE